MALVSAHTLASEDAVYAAADELLDDYMRRTPDINRLGDVSPAMEQLVYREPGRPDLPLAAGRPASALLTAAKPWL